MDAVIREPVSAAKFSDLQGKNREIFEFELGRRELAAKPVAISSACARIPYATEQGKYLA